MDSGMSLADGRPWPVVGAVTAATVTGVLPVALLGGLAVFIRRDIGFSEAGLGALVGIFFGFAAVSSIPAGFFSDRVGPRITLMLAVTFSGGALLGIASIGDSWLLIALFMGIGGVANGLGQPASNLAIATNVQPSSQGVAFGAKQAAIPVSGLLAGLAVPAALLAGWRGVYAVGCSLAVVVLVVLHRCVGSTAKAMATVAHQRHMSARSLMVVSLAGGLGAFSSAPLGVFIVESAVNDGMPAQRAGVLLSLGSAVGICARLAGGWLADRRDAGHLLVISGMLGAGAIGSIMLAFGKHEVVVFSGTLLAFGLGWGWPGLLLHAVVRSNARAPATATGYAQAATALGAVTGPALFGWMAATRSYTIAWSIVAATGLVAAALTAVGHRMTEGSAGDCDARGRPGAPASTSFNQIGDMPCR